MANLVGDTFGLIHLMASLVALVTGALVLGIRKGTVRHKQIGYVYVTSMVLLLLTSFLIFRLYNGWGVFHYTSVASLLTISLGMIPIWTKKPIQKWKFMHFSFMFWSVVGLYSAFLAEILTRVPNAPFFGMVGISFLLVMVASSIFFVRNKSKWLKIMSLVHT